MGSTGVSIPPVSNNAMGGATGASRDGSKRKAHAPHRTTDSPAGNSIADVFKSVPWQEMSVPLTVLGIVVAMITPLPAFLLDILISANITISVIVLLVSMYIVKPVEFSVFPTTLLLLTLFRLALNVSSARLILLNGNSGTAAAGEVIEAFGNFVVGGNYIIGAVIPRRRRSGCRVAWHTAPGWGAPCSPRRWRRG